jgi:DNA processing protein
MKEERVYQVALSLLAGVGPIKAKALVAKVGSPEGVFKEKDRLLGLVPGIGLATVRGMGRKAALLRAEEEIPFLEKYKIDLYYYQDKKYPAKLKFCDDGPVVLFSKGNVNFNKKNVAIVGTRKATPYGKKLTRELIEDLSSLDIQVVSGLAYGIDIEAHRAALDNELSTLAVMGLGLDIIYPAAHKATAKAMLKNGGLVTEYLSRTAGDTSNFPRRNRIVAGLCDAVVIIESGVSGGSLITANLANDYNRDVFAFPGNVDQEFSRGCNNLIRLDKAHLITSADDLVKIMGWEMEEKITEIQAQLFTELTDDEEKIVNVIREKSDIDIDSLSFATSMVSSILSMNLFNLEMKGIVRCAPGKRYSLF